MFKFLIKNDVFNVANRLKSIDKNYFVIYNSNRQKYEVHYKRSGNTYELTVPYDQLDARTIKLVHTSKVENQKQIFENLEKQNALFEQANKKAILENTRRIYEC